MSINEVKMQKGGIIQILRGLPHISTCLKCTTQPQANFLPIVDGSTGFSVVFDIDHENGESQEPHAHGKTNTVHSLVTCKHLTVEVHLQTQNRRASTILTKSWNLEHTESRFN